VTVSEVAEQSVPDSDKSPTPGSARRFSWLFLGISLTGIALILLLNILVDAHGIHMTGWFRPVVANHRLQKEFLLRQLDEPVELLVLGSSRAIAIDPAALEEMTGLRGFNGAVGSAETQDYLAWLRLFIAITGRPPLMIVLGIDEVAFANSRPVADAFNGSDALLATIPEIGKTRNLLPIDRHDLGWSRTWDSLRAVYFTLTGYPPENEKFDANGLGHYIAKEAAVEDGSMDREAGLTESLTDYRARFEKYTAIDPDRVIYFDRFLALVEEHDIELVAFVTPMHPLFAERIEAETVAAQRKAEVREFLRRRFAAHGWPLHEATQPQDYGGDAGNYYDGVHMHPAEMTRLLQSIFEQRQATGKSNDAL
jgi:hypothetical protein